VITPALKGLHVIADDWGDSEDDFWIQLHADIGQKNENGSDIFTIYAVSPKRLAKNDDIEVGRGLFIMNNFNINQIERRINVLLENCKRKTWEEAALAVNRYAYWEYEDYQENHN
jgi:hypothetical protein